jgi:hypothetical protein
VKNKVISNINQIIIKEAGRKRTKDVKENEEMRTAVLNIKPNAVRFCLSSYMDTCRNI